MAEKHPQPLMDVRGVGYHQRGMFLIADERHISEKGVGYYPREISLVADGSHYMN